MEAFKSRNLSSVVESCEERVKEGLERTLARALKWTLHPTEEDAVSELSRAELVFLMAVSALAHLDTEMSGVMLREVDTWTIFPRVTKYMAGKMEAEWRLPRDILERASKFAYVLELSGLFKVPPELRSYLAELLAEDTATGSPELSTPPDQSKRPRKDPRSSPSQQVEESSVRGQASGGEPQQDRRYRLVVRRRRSRKQGGRRQEKKENQVLTLQPFQKFWSTAEPTPGPSKTLTAHPQEMAKTTPGAANMPTAHPQEIVRTTSGAAKTLTPGTTQRTDKPTGAIPKVRQVSSACSQTDEPPTPRAPRVSSAASQTLPLPRMEKDEAQRQLWEGVEKDDRDLIEGAVFSGADLEEKIYNSTPLIKACQSGKLGAVRALVRLGARLEERGGDLDGPALQLAALFGREAVVRELLAAGANLGAKDRNRATPLHAAAAAGHLSVARVLVEAGAPLNPRGSSGRTPLASAEHHGHPDVAAYLRSVGATK